MEIKVLGTGCPKCKRLEQLTRDVVNRNGIDVKIIKVDNIMGILKYNIISTPALVIDEKVVVKGRIPSEEEILQLFARYFPEDHL